MSHRRGSILIVVFFMLGVLSVTALSLAYRAGLESRMVRDRAVQAKIDSYLLSAAAMAVKTLAANTNDWDHPAEAWCDHPDPARQGWMSDWIGDDEDPGTRPEGFIVMYRVEDEQGKLNLAYASDAQLETLGMSKAQIACLFDWMDSDDVRRADGAEQDYYVARARAFRAANQPVQNPDELLRIRHFGRLACDGADLYPDSTRNFLDPGSNPVCGWSQLVTCFGDGRVNLNTADEKVLSTMPISEQAVEQIIAFRRYDEATRDELSRHVFASNETIDQLQGLNEQEKYLLKSLATFKSEYFRIVARCTHVRSGLYAAMELYVQAIDGKVGILKCRKIN